MDEHEEHEDELAVLRAEIAALRGSLEKPPRKRRARIVAIAGATLLAALGSVAGFAYASIPSADNTITACVTTGTGVVRIIDTEANQTCLATEKQVQWGGGMRYIGKWSNIGSLPRSNGYPIIHKGDVVYYDGAPTAFGCSSPRGSWVNVTGGYAYPCLEFPQNWAPLALDGKDGAPGRDGGLDVHWARFDKNGALLASSGDITYSYTSSFYALVQFNGVDLTKCTYSAAVSAPDTSSIRGGITVNAINYYNYVYALAVTNDGGTATNVPLEVTVICTKH